MRWGREVGRLAGANAVAVVRSVERTIDFIVMLNTNTAEEMIDAAVLMSDDANQKWR